VRIFRSVTNLLERVGLKKPSQMPLSRDQAFEARPVRNPRLKWRLNEEENVEVVIPRGKDLFSRAMGFLFFVPESRPVILDEVGTRVWHLCNGENTVDQIIRVLCEEYRLSRREVEASLTEYLRTLGKRGMVGFLIPKEFLDEFEGELVGLEDVGTSREELEAAQMEAEEERAAEEAAEVAGGDEEAAEEGGAGVEDADATPDAESDEETDRSAG